MRETLFRLACAALAALFTFAAYVQHNDPDPLQWMAIYGLAAVASAASAWGRRPLAFPAILALLGLAWALALAPRALWGPADLDGLARWQMTDTRVEEQRELAGLLLLSGWMGAVCLATLSSHRHKPGSGLADRE